MNVSTGGGLLRSRITRVWLLLLLATLLSWELGHGFALSSPQLIRAAVIAVAFIKVRYVILDFMEIRNAPLPMRLVAELWVLLVAITLIAMDLRIP